MRSTVGAVIRAALLSAQSPSVIRAFAVFVVVKRALLIEMLWWRMVASASLDLEGGSTVMAWTTTVTASLMTPRASSQMRERRC